MSLNEILEQAYPDFLEDLPLELKYQLLEELAKSFAGEVNNLVYKVAELENNISIDTSKNSYIQELRAENDHLKIVAEHRLIRINALTKHHQDFRERTELQLAYLNEHIADAIEMNPQTLDLVVNLVNTTNKLYDDIDRLDNSDTEELTRKNNALMHMVETLQAENKKLKSAIEIYEQKSLEWVELVERLNNFIEQHVVAIEKDPSLFSVLHPGVEENLDAFKFNAEKVWHIRNTLGIDLINAKRIWNALKKEASNETLPDP